MLSVRLLLLPFLLSAMALQQENPLSQYQWKNRLILVFSSENNERQAQNQFDEFADQTLELQDRDILVFHINQSEVREGLNSQVVNFKAMEIRESFDVDPDESAVLLVGKDGGVKLRNREGVESKDIYALIDRMPMRRSEMSRKKTN